jgi:hypothetical protein
MGQALSQYINLLSELVEEVELGQVEDLREHIQGLRK